MIIEIKFGCDLLTVNQNELRYRMELAAWKMAWREAELNEDYIAMDWLNIRYESVGLP